MFWRFGFSSTSTLDTLLDKPNVTLEEVLDEDDLLSECKAQNAKLLEYLQQPRVLKRLLEHVVGTAEVSGPGGSDWEERVRFKYPYIASEVLSCEIWGILEGILSNTEELLVPFWDSVLSAHPTPNQPTVPQHMHPLFSEKSETRAGGTGSESGAGSSSQEGGSSDGHGDDAGFESSSAGVLGIEAPPKAEKKESSITTARENGPGRSVLAGYWAKVNGVFLDRQPQKMLDFIRSQPRIVERFVAHLETPAVVDLLYRIIQCEENVPNADVVDWLSERGLIPHIVELLSPSHSADLHNTVSELLKAIIALSAPSPATIAQGQGNEFGYPGGADGITAQQLGGVNNRLIRELASEPMVRRMVTFMLDANLPGQLTRRLSAAADEQLANLTLDLGGAPPNRDAAKWRKPSDIAAQSSTLGALAEDPPAKASDDESALADDDDDEASGPWRPLNPRDTPASESRSPAAADHRDSTATLRPTNFFSPVKAPEVPVTPESCTSSLVTCIGIFIELIRKNNSDYFEQHLFHTLRTHLLQRQQELAEKRTNRQLEEIEKGTDEGKEGDANGINGKSEEDVEMEGMEEAMAELADKLGIVHLGPMLRVLCERLPDFQALVREPRSAKTELSTTLGSIHALTFERYRITELYAELLHCSNMALLNRAPGEGPQYSEDGVLQGGIDGLQILARTLQGGDAASDAADASEQDVKAQAGDDTLKDDEPPKPESSEAPQEADSSAASTPAEEAGAEEEERKPLPAQVSRTKKSGSRAHSREATTHGRDDSSGTSGAGTGSEDTDDEALLNEVSLDDAATPAASGNGGSAEKDPFSDVGDAAPAAAADAEDAASIRSALSNMSLADLVSPARTAPPSPIDDSREYVTGDLLKKKFLQCDVIPTILSLFFEYPWNNFLHNVVYDILQQFFNGRMDMPLNRRLTIAVLEEGQLTERIVKGHQANEESLAGPRRIRLGYMGHLNLIAEETVKLLERYPAEILQAAKQFHLSPEWERFVNETLKENREREAAPLAGGRPTMARAVNFGAGSVLATQGDGDIGANADAHEDGGESNDTFANYLSSQMSANQDSSEDEDSDDDQQWPPQESANAGRVGPPKSASDGFDDAFEPPKSGAAGESAAANDFDDDWGEFTESGDGATFDFAGPEADAKSSAAAYRNGATPDWATEFKTDDDEDEDGGFARAESDDADPFAEPAEAGVADEAGAGPVAVEAEAASSSSSTPRSPTSPSTASKALEEILVASPPNDAVAAAHARRPSLGQSEGTEEDLSSVRASAASGRRRASSGAGSAGSAGSSDPALAHATDEGEPLGPGVAKDAAPTEDGLLERTVDGEAVRVPLDEVALAGLNAAETGEGEEKKNEEEGKAKGADTGESAIID